MIENKYLQTEGLVSRSVPSNIAIVKYWGKREVQLPLNPSVSFSLEVSRTTTSVAFRLDESKQDLSFDFFLDGVPQPSFRPKIEQFLRRILPTFPWLTDFHLTVNSSNSFPHSSGIASSASGMACLAFCLTDIETLLTSGKNADIEQVSQIARLGSGSACRSVWPGWSLWGESLAVEGANNEFAIPINEWVHPAFRQIRDSILILDGDRKKISSSVGHKLMNRHPYRDARIAQANHNTERVIAALKAGDWTHFGEVAEAEALSLHALMLSSEPGYVLLKPESFQAIEWVRTFRQESGLPLYFTFDAGPNMHLLYPAEIEKEIVAFIQRDLKQLCSSQCVIFDRLGIGPVDLNNR